MSLIKKIMTLSSLFLITISLSSCSLINDFFSLSKKGKGEEKFTITWNDGNGKEIYSELVAKGEVPVFKSEQTPTKNSNTQFTYSFNNTWDPEIEAASRDITYTAQFDSNLNKYRVNFIDDDHLLELNDYYYGDIPAYSGVIPPVKEGVDAPDSLFETRFVGWEPEISKVTSNIDYHTVYKRLPKNEIFYVTFEFNNGSDPIVKEYNAGQVIEYPNPPSKIGYTFSSWDYQVTQMPDFDITIRALYSLSSPGEYSWSSENDYINNGKSYTTFTPFDTLVSNNRIGINNNSEVTSYSSSNAAILILPSTIKGIRSISNANMKELFVNTSTSHNFAFYAGCMTSCGIRKLFIEGDGKVTFPGQEALEGYFLKSNACFNSSVFKEVYFNNRQEVINTACLSNQNNSLLRLVLPSTLKKLYYYSFFNTGKSNSSSQYIFATNMSIEIQELPSSLTNFYYINTSDPFVSYTTFKYNGKEDSWSNVIKYSFVYNTSTSIKSQSGLPSHVEVTFN